VSPSTIRLTVLLGLLIVHTSTYLKRSAQNKLSPPPARNSIMPRLVWPARYNTTPVSTNAAGPVPALKLVIDIVVYYMSLSFINESYTQ